MQWSDSSDTRAVKERRAEGPAVAPGDSAARTGSSSQGTARLLAGSPASTTGFLCSHRHGRLLSWVPMGTEGSQQACGRRSGDTCTEREASLPSFPTCRADEDLHKRGASETGAPLPKQDPGSGEGLPSSHTSPNGACWLPRCR